MRLPSSLRCLSDTYRTLIVAPQVACGELTVYADDDKDTHRDVMTATAFMSGLLPQCIPTVQHDMPMVSYLFNQGGIAKPQPKCGGMPSEKIVAATLVGGSISKLAHANRDILSDLSKAIDCCEDAICATNPTPPAAVSSQAICLRLVCDRPVGRF